VSAPGNDRLQLAWRPFHFRLPMTLVTAHGALVERRGWLLRLSRDDGAVGWGEAAPWPGGPEQRQVVVGPGSSAVARTPLPAFAPPPPLALPQLQLAAVEIAIAQLGPSLGRRELEAELPALAPCLGFALGLALAELDGLGIPGDAEQGHVAGSRAPWGGPWRAAPPSAWLLPAGEAVLAALEAVLERAEQLQGAEPPAGSSGRPGAAGAPASGAMGDVDLGAAAAVAPDVVGGAADAVAPPAAAWRGAPQAAGPFTFKWKVAAGPDPEERAVLEQLLMRLPHGSRLRLDANGGWDRATAQAWAVRLASDPRLEWLEQPLAPADLEGLAALAALVPVALDESLRFDPGLRQRWPGWQVRRPSLEGDPRPLLQALTTGTPRLMLSTAFETGIGRRFLAHLAALQQDGPTPTAPGLAPGWRPAGALFDNDPALVWAAAGER